MVNVMARKRWKGYGGEKEQINTSKSMLWQEINKEHYNVWFAFKLYHLKHDCLS